MPMHKPVQNTMNSKSITAKIEYDTTNFSLIELGVRTSGEIIRKEENTQCVRYHVLRLIHQNELVEGIFWEGETIGSIVKACFNNVILDNKNVIVQKNLLLVIEDSSYNTDSNDFHMQKSYCLLYATKKFDMKMIKEYKNNNNVPLSKYIKNMSVQIISNFSKPHGLTNIGNTCFMNSGLQCLLALTPFMNMLVCGVFGNMASVFVDLLMYKKQPNSFWTEFTSKVKRFGDYMQHDVQEFVGCLLDCIDCENDSKVNLPNKSIDENQKSTSSVEKKQSVIDICFKGKLSSRSKCLSCNFEFNIYEPFLNLSLSIPPPENFHSGIYYSGRILIKLNVPKYFRVKDLKRFISQELRSDENLSSLIDTNCLRHGKEFENVKFKIKNHMIVSINNSKRTILEDEMFIRDHSTVFCYEYDPNEKYTWVLLKRKRIIYDYFVAHFLLRCGDDVESAIDTWTNQSEQPMPHNEQGFDLSDCLENSSRDELQFGTESEMNDHSIFSSRRYHSESILADNDSFLPDNLEKTRKSNSDSGIYIKTNLHKDEIPCLGQNNHLYKTQNSSAKIFDLNPDITFFKSIRSEEIVQINNLFRLKNTVTLNIIDCIKYFIKQELLTDVNKPYCVNCKTKADHLKDIRISELPQCLIIHIKRFAYLGTTKKIMTKINANKMLKFGDKCYKLVSFANHKARSASSGHYTAYVNRAGEWWLCNDFSISKTNVLNEDDAYLLFYEAINYNQYLLNH